MSAFSFVIRRATAEDSDRLQQFFQTCREQATWLPDEVRYNANFAEESTDETVLVAVDEHSAIVGLISVFVAEAFVHHLYVRRDCQRQGIGQALLSELHAFLPYPWRLKCPPANAAALKFYKAQGWWEVARGQSDWGKYVLLEFSGPQLRSGKC